MAIYYSSTRGGETNVTASQAILKGLAEDGGLFMPNEIPALDCSFEELSKMTYQEAAYEVMKLFLTDFTEEELKSGKFAEIEEREKNATGIRTLKVSYNRVFGYCFG